jgi:hypothetical protein
LGLAEFMSVGHTAAALAARTAEGPRWALLGDYLPEFGCWLLSAVAVVLLVRSRVEAGGLGALAAVGLVLGTLVRAGAVLGASTVLIALPADLDRALVAGTVGLSAGVFAGLLMMASGQVREIPTAYLPRSVPRYETVWRSGVMVICDRFSGGFPAAAQQRNAASTSSHKRRGPCWRI